MSVQELDGKVFEELYGTKKFIIKPKALSSSYEFLSLLDSRCDIQLKCEKLQVPKVETCPAQKPCPSCAKCPDTPQCRNAPEPTTTTTTTKAPTTTTTTKAPTTTTTTVKIPEPPRTYLPVLTTVPPILRTCPNGARNLPFCCKNGADNEDCCENGGSGPDCCTNGGKGKYCCLNGANNPDCCENGGRGKRFFVLNILIS